MEEQRINNDQSYKGQSITIFANTMLFRRDKIEIDLRKEVGNDYWGNIKAIYALAEDGGKRDRFVFYNTSLSMAIARWVYKNLLTPIDGCSFKRVYLCADRPIEVAKIHDIPYYIDIDPKSHELSPPLFLGAEMLNDRIKASNPQDGITQQDIRNEFDKYKAILIEYCLSNGFDKGDIRTFIDSLNGELKIRDSDDKEALKTFLTRDVYYLHLPREEVIRIINTVFNGRITDKFATFFSYHMYMDLLSRNPSNDDYANGRKYFGISTGGANFHKSKKDGADKTKKFRLADIDKEIILACKKIKPLPDAPDNNDIVGWKTFEQDQMDIQNQWASEVEDTIFKLNPSFEEYCKNREVDFDAAKSILHDYLKHKYITTLKERCLTCGSKHLHTYIKEAQDRKNLKYGRKDLDRTVVIKESMISYRKIVNDRKRNGKRSNDPLIVGSSRIHPNVAFFINFTNNNLKNLGFSPLEPKNIVDAALIWSVVIQFATGMNGKYNAFEFFNTMGF